jgi:hypothetical protein
MMRKTLALSIMIALLTNSFPLMSIGNVLAGDAQATSTPININLSQEESTRFTINQQDKIVHDNETNLDWSLKIKTENSNSLEDAQNYCQTLGADRRVPSITEIRTLRRTRTNTQQQFHFNVFQDAIKKLPYRYRGVFYTSTKSLRREGKVWFVASQDLANKREMWNEPNPLTPKRVICVKGTRNTSLNQGDKGGKSNLTYSFVD